jgi:Coenzyme PQQ synthesis protein D (PqqD)
VIGCRIWELIDGERTAAEIIEAIRAEVEDPPPALADEVNSFIDAMRDRDLILANA